MLTAAQARALTGSMDTKIEQQLEKLLHRVAINAKIGKDTLVSNDPDTVWQLRSCDEPSLAKAPPFLKGVVNRLTGLGYQVEFTSQIEQPSALPNSGCFNQIIHYQIKLSW